MSSSRVVQKVQLAHQANQQRNTQLDKEGKNPKLICDLAKDAKKLAELLTSLRGQACEAREFVLKYGQWYGGNQGELQGIVDRFESIIRIRSCNWNKQLGIFRSWSVLRPFSLQHFRPRLRDVGACLGFDD